MLKKNFIFLKKNCGELGIFFSWFSILKLFFIFRLLAFDFVLFISYKKYKKENEIIIFIFCFSILLIISKLINCLFAFLKLLNYIL